MINANAYDPLPISNGAVAKFSHSFSENQRVILKETGMKGAIEKLDDHNNIHVKLDSGHFIRCHPQELQPEDWTQAPALAQDASAKIAKVSDPLPVPAPLQKRRSTIDPADVAVGMRVKGHDGLVGTISKVNGASVLIDFPNGTGVSLITCLEAA